MECNKDEAIRAREIAEQRMGNKDFAGARKILLRAQRLCPDLENISQMLTVCEVHRAAEQKVLGTEMDWYGVLQVQRTADQISIKKQYRKLALVLHPDKNTFPGAEAAFKLIGEAHEALNDHMKRRNYDEMLRTFVRSPMPMQPPNRNVQTAYTTGINPQCTSFKPQQQQPQQQPQQQQHSGPRFATGRQTFFTICPFCLKRNENYKDVVDQVLHCQYCKQPFMASNLDSRVEPQGANCTHSTFSQPKVFSVQTDPTAHAQYPFGNIYSMGYQGNCGQADKAANLFTNARRNTSVDAELKVQDTKVKNEGVKVGKVHKSVGEKSRESKPSEKKNKRVKTLPDTQSKSEVGTGAKPKGKAAENAGMGVVNNAEKVTKCMSEKTNKIGRSLRKTQSNSIGGTASKVTEKVPAVNVRPIVLGLRAATCIVEQKFSKGKVPRKTGVAKKLNK